MSRCLVDQGDVLQQHTRPILSRDGHVMLRLVWRRRRDNSTAVMQQPLTGAILVGCMTR